MNDIASDWNMGSSDNFNFVEDHATAELSRIFDTDEDDDCNCGNCNCSGCDSPNSN